MFSKYRNGMTLQVLAAVGLSVAVTFLLVIVGADTKKVAERVVETGTEISTRVRQSGEIARLKEEAAMAEGKKQILESTLPQKDELFTFPNQVAQVGSTNSVQTTFTFGKEGAGEINYSLVAQGNYANITEFLRTLENSIPFMNISSFNLVIGGSGYNMSLGGKIFFNGKEG